MGLGQSMSHRGNCWDNAPQESFFGHFKDETNIKDCETLEEVKSEIKSYMTYYNHDRGQWNLKKLPPAKTDSSFNELLNLFQNVLYKGYTLFSSSFFIL